MKIPILEGEPQILYEAAAQQKSYTDAVIALGKLPEVLRGPISNLVRIVNESAFVAGVMYERKFAIAELQEAAEAGHDTHPHPVTCFRDDHVVDGKILCATEGAGPCNGYPRAANHTDNCGPNGCVNH